MNADICCGVYSLPYILNLKSVPIFLLAAIMVPSGFIEACLRAGSPTSFCPSFVKATYEGNAFPLAIPAPSALGIIAGLSFSMKAAAEFEVPKSIPITLAISCLLVLIIFSLRRTPHVLRPTSYVFYPLRYLYNRRPKEPLI